jgi:hypothetical protein
MRLQSCNHNYQDEDVFFSAILFLYPFFITRLIITQIGKENKFSAEVSRPPFFR